METVTATIEVVNLPDEEKQIVQEMEEEECTYEEVQEYLKGVLGCVKPSRTQM